FGQPVLGRAPHRVTLVRPESRLEFLVELLQLLLDNGLGLAGDPGPDPLAVRAEPQADRAPPPPLAVPVPLAVPARGVVVEVDRVFAPATSCGHGPMIAIMGAISGSHLPATPGYVEPYLAK